jgi:hypothetical protein
MNGRMIIEKLIGYNKHSGSSFLSVLSTEMEFIWGTE